MKGYDQWKTASPYDEEIDLGESECPRCTCFTAHEQQGCDGVHVEFWCPECGHTFKVPIEQCCPHLKGDVTEENFSEIEDLTTG